MGVPVARQTLSSLEGGRRSSKKTSKHFGHNQRTHQKRFSEYEDRKILKYPKELNANPEIVFSTTVLDQCIQYALHQQEEIITFLFLNLI